MWTGVGREDVAAEVEGVRLAGLDDCADSAGPRDKCEQP